MVRFPYVAAALGALVILILGLAFAAKPAPVVDAKPEAPNVVDEDGFEHLPTAIWNTQRLRWCSLMDLATNPERAGSTISTALELSSAKGANFQIWHFYDSNKNLTLTSVASECLTQVKMSLPAGRYRFDFVEATETVTHDAAVDDASSLDAAFHACHTEFPAPMSSDLQVATVVDTDGTVWTSDGTRDEKSLRGCLGRAHNDWVKAQIAAGTYAAAAPSVVYGHLAVEPAPGAPPEAPKPAGKVHPAPMTPPAATPPAAPPKPAP